MYNIYTYVTGMTFRPEKLLGGRALRLTLGPTAGRTPNLPTNIVPTKIA